MNHLESVEVELDRDEFAHLAAEAKDAGAYGRPDVSRCQLTSKVSALHWGNVPATTVLLHGVALNAHTWDTMCVRWFVSDPKCGFLALDLPGHGESSWRTDADYAPATLCSTIADALAAASDQGLLASSYCVVGHSLGGLVALELTRTPASLHRLVLVDILPLPPAAAATIASFLDGPTRFESRNEIIERALAFGLGGRRDALERAVVLNTRRTADHRIVWKHHFGELGGRGLRTGGHEQQWDRVADSPIPIDLVAAQQSFVDADALDRFLRLRPGARAIRLSGGHNLQEDSPGDLADALRITLREFTG